MDEKLKEVGQRPSGICEVSRPLPPTHTVKEVRVTEAPLSTRQRNELPDSSFAIPEDRAYPIDTRNRAINALARVEQFGSDEEKSRVRNAVYRRYPDLRPDEED